MLKYCKTLQYNVQIGKREGMEKCGQDMKMKLFYNTIHSNLQLLEKYYNPVSLPMIADRHPTSNIELP